MSWLLGLLLMGAAEQAAAPASGPVQPPTAEQTEAARVIARNSVVATLIPLQTKADIDKIIAENPNLSSAEQNRLREVGQREADAMLVRFVEADAAAYAANLSLADLRAIAEFESSPPAARRRAAMPAIIQATVTRLGELDFGKSVRTAFCAETGKLCN